MNLFKKTVISLLAMLPLGAVSYAAEFENKVDVNKADIQAEFERRLLDYELPSKYYNYLQRQSIESLDDLVADKNHAHYLRMLKEFEKDIQGGVMASSGAISIGGTF